MKKYCLSVFAVFICLAFFYIGGVDFSERVAGLFYVAITCAMSFIIAFAALGLTEIEDGRK